MTPLAKLTSWSYSVYTSYLRCPMSVMFDKIKRIRIVEPPNPHFEKGNRVHDGAARYILTPDKAMPALMRELKKKRLDDLVPTYELLKGVEDRLKAFRALKASAEQEWAFTSDWKPTRWDNWTGAWLRAKVDVCSVDMTGPSPLIQITDWKTGKQYSDHTQQRSLYALTGLQMVELGLLADGRKDVKLVVEHTYIDTTQSATESFALKDLRSLKREWAARIREMMNDTVYRARPSAHACRYCKFNGKSGGPCKEGV